MRKLVVLTLVSLILLQITSLFAGKWTSDGKKFASDLAYYASKVRKYNDRYVVLCVPLTISFLSPDLTDESFDITGMGFSLGDYKDPECLVDFAIKYYKKSKIMKNIEKNYKILIRYDPEEYSKNPYRVLYYDRSMKYLVDLIEKYGSRESESGLDFMKKGEVIGYWRSWSQEEWDFIKLVGSVKAFYNETIRKLVGTQCFGMKAHCLLEVRDYLDNADEDDIREYYIAGILKNGDLAVQGILAFKVGRKYYLAALGGKYDFENTVDEDYAELLQYKPGYIDEKWLNSYLKFMESGKNPILGQEEIVLSYFTGIPRRKESKEFWT